MLYHIPILIARNKAGLPTKPESTQYNDCGLAQRVNTTLNITQSCLATHILQRVPGKATAARNRKNWEDIALNWTTCRGQNTQRPHIVKDALEQRQQQLIFACAKLKLLGPPEFQPNIDVALLCWSCWGQWKKWAARHLKPAVDMKTLEIDGKRSHVRRARSGNLLSAADDTVICAAIWGTKWQNRGKHPIHLDLNSPMKII